MPNLFLIGLQDRLYSNFRPLLSFFLAKNIPLSIRLRLLLFQPIELLTSLIVHLPWLFRHKPWRAEYIPLSSSPSARYARILIFDKTPRKLKRGTLRPLHIDIHGGAFIGGCAEADAVFCSKLASEAGAVVISITYRVAPMHIWPAAIDDVDAIIAYLLEHAAERYGADPNLLTIGGFSAGGHLAWAATQRAGSGVIQGIVTYYAAIDLRLAPWEKPKGFGMPKKDPAEVLLPLFDLYPRLVRARESTNPRFAPIVAEVETLPGRMLLIVPGIDILVHEQLTFVERVRGEIEGSERLKGKKSINGSVYDKGFHGWVECKLSLWEVD